MSGSTSTDQIGMVGSHPPVLGIDIGGSSVKSVVLAGGSILSRSVAPREQPITEVLEQLIGLGLDQYGVAAAGVGIAGLVDASEGRFVWGPHLSDRQIDVSVFVDSLIDSHVVDNDANFAAYAEWANGAARRHRVALTVSIGTGIGAGLVVDGSIWRGSGFAGEVGHMRLTERGSPCPCGRVGCWETLVSGRQLGLEASRLGLGATAADLASAALDGSDAARESLRAAGDWLGVGIANLIMAFDPGVVVVAGGVSGAGDLILDAARERIASGLPGAGHRPAVEVAEATHGRWAAAIGAAYVVARCHAGGGTIRGDVEE